MLWSNTEDLFKQSLRIYKELKIENLVNDTCCQLLWRHNERKQKESGEKRSRIRLRMNRGRRWWLSCSPKRPPGEREGRAAPKRRNTDVLPLRFSHLKFSASKIKRKREMGASSNSQSKQRISTMPEKGMGNPRHATSATKSEVDHDILRCYQACEGPSLKAMSNWAQTVH